MTAGYAATGSLCKGTLALRRGLPVSQEYISRPEGILHLCPCSTPAKDGTFRNTAGKPETKSSKELFQTERAALFVLPQFLGSTLVAPTQQPATRVSDLVYVAIAALAGAFAIVQAGGVWTEIVAVIVRLSVVETSANNDESFVHAFAVHRPFFNYSERRRGR
jgi:hypothetical protein